MCIRDSLFPFARHGNIGDAHRLDDGIEGKSFFGGNKRLLAAVSYTHLDVYKRQHLGTVTRFVVGMIFVIRVYHAHVECLSLIHI